MDTVKVKDQELKVYYKHVRDDDVFTDGDITWKEPAAKGGHTQATVWIDDFTAVSSFSKCSKKDTFSRREGRNKSLARLRTYLGDTTPIPVPPPKEPKKAPVDTHGAS